MLLELLRLAIKNVGVKKIMNGIAFTVLKIARMRKLTAKLTILKIARRSQQGTELTVLKIARRG
jgi:hypothetical protein